MKKTVCILLALLLLNTGGVLAAPSGVSISAQNVASNLPAGSLIGVSSSCGQDIERLEFFETKDGNLLALGECLPNETFYTELKEYEREIFAKGFSGDTEKTNSNTVKITSGFKEEIVNDIYNLDFEDVTAVRGTETNPRVSLKKNGNYILSPQGNGMTGFIGDSANDIAIDETVSEVIKDNTFGKSLHLDSNGIQGKKVEFNNVYIETKSGITVLEMDYYSNCLSNAATVMVTNHSTASNSNIWDRSVSYKDGAFTFNGKNAEVCNEPKWHHVKQIFDIDNSSTALLIDGRLMESYKISDDAITRLNRIEISLPAGTETDAWIDNFRVYQTEPAAQIKSVTGAENTVSLTLTKRIPTEDIKDIEICYGENKLLIKDYEYRENENILDVNTLQNVFTNVPLKIKITYTSGDGEMQAEAAAALECADFEVLYAEMTTEGGKTGAKAALVNKTGLQKTAAMLLCFLDENGAVKKVCVSKQVTVGDTETVIEIEPVLVDAAVAEVFFIDNFTYCKPVKNVIYRFDK